MNSVVKGLYRHYKGKLYVVIGTAIEENSQQIVVIYHEQYKKRPTFTRPIDQFTEARFSLVREHTNRRRQSTTS